MVESLTGNCARAKRDSALAAAQVLIPSCHSREAAREDARPTTCKVGETDEPQCSHECSFLLLLLLLLLLSGRTVRARVGVGVGVGGYPKSRMPTSKWSSFGLRNLAF